MPKPARTGLRTHDPHAPGESPVATERPEHPGAHTLEPLEDTRAGNVKGSTPPGEERLRS
ncbi:hypothetical protein GCM10023108_42480 [Saccharopolyspora hordei]